MERGSGQISAVQEVKKTHKIPVISIVDLNDLTGYLQKRSDLINNLQAVERYRAQYGVG